MSEGSSGPIGANRASKGKSNSHCAAEVASIELPAGRARRQNDRWPSHAPTSATHRLKVRARKDCGYAGTSRRRVVHGNPHPAIQPRSRMVMKWMVVYWGPRIEVRPSGCSERDPH